MQKAFCDSVRDLALNDHDIGKRLSGFLFNTLLPSALIEKYVQTEKSVDFDAFFYTGLCPISWDEFIFQWRSLLLCNEQIVWQFEHLMTSSHENARRHLGNSLSLQC
jgi:hypothetical protein